MLFSTLLHNISVQFQCQDFLDLYAEVLFSIRSWFIENLVLLISDARPFSPYLRLWSANKSFEFQHCLVCDWPIISRAQATEHDTREHYPKNYRKYKPTYPMLLREPQIRNDEKRTARDFRFIVRLNTEKRKTRGMESLVIPKIVFSTNQAKTQILVQNVFQVFPRKSCKTDNFCWESLA